MQHIQRYTAISDLCQKLNNRDKERCITAIAIAIHSVMKFATLFQAVVIIVVYLMNTKSLFIYMVITRDVIVCFFSFTYNMYSHVIKTYTKQRQW